jgi:hypothetical protein
MYWSGRALHWLRLNWLGLHWLGLPFTAPQLGQNLASFGILVPHFKHLSSVIFSSPKNLNPTNHIYSFLFLLWKLQSYQNV